MTESTGAPALTVWERYRDTALGTAILARPTPSVFYAEGKVCENLRAYQSVAPGFKKELRYAVKACPLRPVLDCIARAGWGADCQSVMEAKLALRAGIPPSAISLCSPRASLEELAWAVSRGLCFIADSRSQLELLARVMERESAAPNFELGIRISLPVPGTSRFHAKFGMELAEIVAVFNARPGLKPYLRELHHHGAARETSPELLTEVCVSLLSSLADLEDRLKLRFSRLNLGGGLEPDSVLAAHGWTTHRIVDEMLRAADNSERIMSERTLVFEPGRAIVKDSAIGVTTVTNIKVLRDSAIAVVDLSTNVLIPLPLAHFFARHPDEPIDTDASRRYDIVDGTCSPAGVICKQALLPPLKEGGRLIIEYVGAYTWSLAEPFYDLLPDLWWISAMGEVASVFTRENAEAVKNLMWGYS